MQLCRKEKNMKKMVFKQVWFFVALFLLSGVMAASAQVADKLVVKDAAGTNTVFKVDNTGTVQAAKIGVGTANPQTTIHNAEISTSPSRGIMAAQHNDGAQAASMVFRKSRGTEAAPAQLVQNDYIGIFAAQYWNDTTYDRSAQFGFRTDGPVTAGSAPTAIMFFTGASTNAADPLILAERLRISSAGLVGVGTSTPTSLLDVNSNGIRVRTAKTPSSSAAACNQGDMSWDANFVYVCVAANTWKRATLASW